MWRPRSTRVRIVLGDRLRKIVRRSETAATNSYVPERLKRLEQVFKPTPIYFVTACTAERRKLLAKDSIHDTFRSFAQAGGELGAWVGSYIFMPDHFHLFVKMDRERLTLSCWMKSLKGTLSAELRFINSKPPFWQKGFFDHVLRNRDSYSAKWLYVRENAVRAGLVSAWEHWPFLGEICDITFHGD
jgi:putative transposase